MHMSVRAKVLLIQGSRYTVACNDYLKMMDDLRTYEWATMETIDRSPDEILIRLDPEDPDAYIVWATTHTDPYHAGTLKDSATYEQLYKLEAEIVKEMEQ